MKILYKKFGNPDSNKAIPKSTAGGGRAKIPTRKNFTKMKNENPEELDSSTTTSFKKKSQKI